jgi:hypothetical protein
MAMPFAIVAQIDFGDDENDSTVESRASMIIPRDAILRVDEVLTSRIPRSRADGFRSISCVHIIMTMFQIFPGASYQPRTSTVPPERNVSREHDEKA